MTIYEPDRGMQLIILRSRLEAYQSYSSSYFISIESHKMKYCTKLLIIINTQRVLSLQLSCKCCSPVRLELGMWLSMYWGKKYSTVTIYYFIYTYAYIYYIYTVYIEGLLSFIFRRVHNKFQLGLFSIICLFLNFCSALVSNLFQKNNNYEHSKYVKILVLIEQHSNCRLFSVASPVTWCSCLFFIQCDQKSCPWFKSLITHFIL